MPVLAMTCTNCSAPLDPAQAVGGMIRCGYCRMVFQLAGAPIRPPAVPDQPGNLRAVLERIPANKKIQAIKVIREATGLGLKESKELVERAPVDIGVFPPDKGRLLAREVSAFGGVVGLYPA